MRVYNYVCVCACISLSFVFCWFVFPSFDGCETLIKINIIGFALHLTNVFSSGWGPFIPWDVWKWKPSSFSKVGSQNVSVSSLESLFPKLSTLSPSLSFSTSPSPPTFSSPFSVTLTFHFSLTSHKIHYITAITHHCHANNLPTQWQKLKQNKISFSLIFHCF